MSAWTEAVGQVIGETRTKLPREYKPRIDALEAKIKQLEQQSSMEARFAELERHLDARQAARDQSKRGSRASGERRGRQSRFKGAPALARPAADRRLEDRRS